MIAVWNYFDIEPQLAPLGSVYYYYNGPFSTSQPGDYVAYSVKFVSNALGGHCTADVGTWNGQHAGRFSTGTCSLGLLGESFFYFTPTGPRGYAFKIGWGGVGGILSAVGETPPG